jgi:dihydroxyacetone kinase-like protein
LTASDALPLAAAIAAALEAAYDEITALDAEVGDGDLGVTCRLGMTAVLQVLPTFDGSPPTADATPDAILMKSGMTFNSAGASTYGALVATAAMRAAKYAKDNEVGEWDLPALIGAATAAAEGIEQRGKASRGDKTILDALWPAVDALKVAQTEGKSLAEAFADAAVAAREGAEATKPLRSKFGRAAWMQDRTIGVQDAGATVAAIVIAAVAGYVAA